MGQTTHEEARKVLELAYQLQEQPPTTAELQLAAAVAHLESHYGDAWRRRGVRPDPHNWGNVQCGHVSPCGPGCFEAPDSDPETGAYAACFRIYGSPVFGAAAMLEQLYRREGVPDAMRNGDARAMAAAMYDTGYYRGHGDTREERIDGYARGLEARRAQIAKALGETVEAAPGRWSLLPWALGAGALAVAAYFLGRR